ncbi:MAG: hypothetical protein H6748_18460 [Spirochaetaceae bacterium]|mgnify:CR=1 FL=1|nr:hypothetical protein [Myxococcales bacterium]MCB9726039.1 hypothetical protein [Spirochaetaceae bacterium]HPG24862.1 hypothetical protein [Myxococcota bacterium]
MRRFVLSIAFFVLAVAPGFAEEPGGEGEKLVSGMSIVGNDEAPKSLVIVPWKSSALGASIDVEQGLDDGRAPVDREVFVRELDYYEIRTGESR